ncbi:carbohydrate ABC transporter permease [Streptomyces millisiae]|uniref:Carbohydrate ABC transporter permease n=1 Tax=Streptomyces millisiae TaxID=3075542 RepID=A0ABU2LUV4_9ACTN|nr:carbohydrate ABC transporter permease [Streptomyces sp. DSM 44918]MDT0321382.1 carbohydrate ABC transporter permease [Streptomyces sp. DSM 44918]
MTRTPGPQVATPASPRASRPRRLGPRLRRAPVVLVILLLLAVEVYPLFWLVMNSLKSSQEFLNTPSWQLPTEFRWDNYATAWEQGMLATTIRNSLVATIPSLLLIIVLGVAAGFALEVMVWRGRHAVLLAVLGGIMIPGQMILLPLFTIYLNLDLTGSLWPLIITYTAHGLPLTIFMMATYFRAIPREIFEASTIDGASVLRSFVSIGFPMVRNAVLTVTLVQFFLIWNDLLFAITFANRRELNTVQAGLLNFSGQYGALDYGPLFAAICIAIGGVLTLYLFLNQRIMQGLVAGSVKG